MSESAFCSGLFRHCRATLWVVNWIRISLVLILLAVLSAACSPDGQTPVIEKATWVLRTPGEIPAPVQRAAIDPDHRTAYLATQTNLFTVRDGVAKSLTKQPTPNTEIALAPGGSVYALLEPANGGPAPLWNIQLRKITGESLAQLKPKEAPFGFGGIYLGFRGKLIVTVTAIDDWRGIRGRYRFTFWDVDGRVLKTVIRPTREIGIMASDGSSFLLLGKKEATAYSPDGELLWRLDGSFRKGTIARGGGLALLNPSARKAINQVHVFTGSGKLAKLEMPTPVHRLRLAPDGTAVVGGDRGRYFFLDPNKAAFKEGPQLPFKAGLFITDLGFVNKDTLAVGVLLREGKPPGHSWPRGGLIVINRDGKVLFKEEYAISKQISSRPGVDVTFGVPTVIGFTLDKAVRIELGQ